MRNLIKINIAILFLCFVIQAKAQTITLSGKVEKGGGKQLLLSKISGGQVIHIDSLVLNANGEYVFSLNKPYKGMCRLSFDGVHYIEIVINNENTIIDFNAEKPDQAAKVFESSENKVYFSFLSATRSINDSIDAISLQGEKLFEKDKVLYKKELENLAEKINQFYTSRNKLALSISQENKNLFASKIIIATVIPEYSKYLEKEKDPVFKSENEFLKYHYLDNIDFSDSALLNTPVIYDVCGDYIRYFSNPPSVKTYKEIIDILMGKVSGNGAIQEYVTEILLKSFDTPSWEDVYTYVADNYYLTSTCAGKADSASVSNKSGLIKKLKPGNIAPDITIEDENGKFFMLGENKSKYILVFFWASWCEFCEDAMPETKKIYADYKPKGLEIVCISADTINETWISASKKNGIIWINACDLKGFSSNIFQAYNVLRTPNFYLIDENKTIVGHFYNVTAVRKALETLKWQ